MAPWIAPGLCQNRGEQMSKFLNLKKAKTEFVSLYLFFLLICPPGFCQSRKAPNVFSTLQNSRHSQESLEQPGHPKATWGRFCIVDAKPMGFAIGRTPIQLGTPKMEDFLSKCAKSMGWPEQLLPWILPKSKGPKCFLDFAKFQIFQKSMGRPEADFKFLREK